MVAQLHDGHGVVYLGEPGKKALPPIRVDWIEDEVVVVAVGETDLLKKGDVIKTIDGRSAHDEVKLQESMISGSPHLRRHRALNVFGLGDPAAEAVIAIERGGETLTVKVPRTDRPNIFFSAYLPWDYAMVRELPSGFLYVNLRKLDKEALKEHLPQLAKAKGLILDHRWGGGDGKFGLLRHLTKESLTSPQWYIPQVIYPDRREMTFMRFDWELEPEEPRINCRCVILQGPSVVSSGETFLGIVQHYDLAELVGAPSAGCNGNVNFIPLPGGLRIMFTGMKTLQHDGSQHHLIGIRPKHPVRRTIAAVREDRDEVFDKAIEVLSR